MNQLIDNFEYFDIGSQMREGLGAKFFLTSLRLFCKNFSTDPTEHLVDVRKLKNLKIHILMQINTTKLVNEPNN